MGKSVLLFSSGTDSFIVSRLIKPDIHLYFDLGTEEVYRELETCERLGITPIVDHRLYLKDQELPNKIVPMRNLFFILIACYYGDNIYMGATKGDFTADCTEEFRNISNSLLASLYKIPEKNPRGVHLPQIYFPVKHLTKTGLVKEYLEKGFSVEELKMTRSCYKGGQLKDCGICSSCFRKWIAYVNNQISKPTDFLNNPLDSVVENLLVVKNFTGEYDDLLVALKKVGYNG